MDDGWERGDLLGHRFPVHLEALRAAGPEFLTGAFRAAGAMDTGNRVIAVTRLEPFSGGSTGRKAELSVTYARSGAGLPGELFVKFSRDLDDELRDRGRHQMASEVRFGLLSHLPDFPVSVPACLFGEYHLASGSGLLISERIAFGRDGVEPHHPKARDHELEDARGHYEALISALGRLAGTHRAGRFPDDVMAHFAPRADGPPARPPSTTPEKARARIDQYADFAGRFPQLLPPSIRSDEFLGRLRRQVPRALEHAAAIRAARRSAERELTAFCHWNANIDNAWFWREGDGLACGLLDWGNVGVMNLVTAISSCLAFAEPEFVIEHLDHLLARFAEAFEDAGGGSLDPALLRHHFALHLVAGGLQWPLGAASLLERHVPDLADVADRFDPRIVDDEFARTQLHLLRGYLVLWEALEPEADLDGTIRRFNAGTVTMQADP